MDHATVAGLYSAREHLAGLQADNCWASSKESTHQEPASCPRVTQASCRSHFGRAAASRATCLLWPLGLRYPAELWLAAAPLSLQETVHWGAGVHRCLWTELRAAISYSKSWQGTMQGSSSQSFLQRRQEGASDKCCVPTSSSARRLRLPQTPPVKQLPPDSSTSVEDQAILGQADG